MAYYVLTGHAENVSRHVFFFGDYDRECVDFEKDCVKRDGGVTKLKVHRLTSDTQSAIDALLGGLNNGP